MNTVVVGEEMNGDVQTDKSDLELPPPPGRMKLIIGMIMEEDVQSCT